MEEKVQVKTRKCHNCNKNRNTDQFNFKNRHTCKPCLYKRTSKRYYNIKERYEEAAGGQWWLEQYFRYYEANKKMSRR